MVERARPVLVDARELARYQSVETGASPVALKKLWLGVLLAPGAWLVGELVGYYLAARSCEPGPAGIPLAGTAYPAPVHIVLELVLAVVAAIGLGLALSSWRRLRDDCAPDEPTAAGRARFMAVTGLVTSALFIFGILLFGFSGFVVNSCSQAR